MSTSVRRLFWVLCILLTSASLVAAQVSIEAGGTLDTWSKAERVVLQSLHIDSIRPQPSDPSNAYEHVPAAVELGKRIFFDARFSANQKLSCASCHNPQQQFQDGLPLAKGFDVGLRRTMPIAGSGHNVWQFWDGRKDSLWSQALGPLEDAREHGGNRLTYAKVIYQNYRKEYEALFSALPPMNDLPEKASPVGSTEERSAWEKMSSAQRQDVSRVFANMGKAIAAYEKTLNHGPSRLDSYVAATLKSEPGAAQILSPSEKRGLRLFMGKAECITCHGGPLLTDQHFHNTGIAPLNPKNPDLGRAAAIVKVLQDEFNCLGQFSDANKGQCQELEFLATDDPHMLGAFKTPTLRNVALRPPYMHAGQIDTLDEVIRHYAKAPRAAVGQNERKPMNLSEQEVADLVSFLRTLSGPIREAEKDLDVSAHESGIKISQQ